ncbi:MAG: hypothetical protein A4E73_03787 [Syntrophaceae bacterium PtaU1.Bin231]|nr:MAG: hypothetical protein A4E73_03787 [Syntrophaceae bacterium PtaU1.Bin231]
MPVAGRNAERLGGIGRRWENRSEQGQVKDGQENDR